MKAHVKRLGRSWGGRSVEGPALRGRRAAGALRPVTLTFTDAHEKKTQSQPGWKVRSTRVPTLPCIHTDTHPDRGKKRGQVGVLQACNHKGGDTEAGGSLGFSYQPAEPTKQGLVNEDCV